MTTQIYDDFYTNTFEDDNLFKLLMIAELEKEKSDFRSYQLKYYDSTKKYELIVYYDKKDN